MSLLILICRLFAGAIDLACLAIGLNRLLISVESNLSYGNGTAVCFRSVRPDSTSTSSSFTPYPQIWAR